MKNRIFRKCFFTLGLLLFFTLLLPLNPMNAYASSIDKEKSADYRLNLKNVTLVKGKSFSLKVYNVTESMKISFKSNDADTASVSDDGVVSANKVGFATITVSVKDGTTTTPLTCDVTVGPPAFSVKMTKSRIILGLDKSDSLRVILKPSNTAEVARFSSYDSSIASVSIGGRVTAKKLGLTYLFAEIDADNGDGTRKFSPCTVIVTNPDDAPLLEDYFNNHPELDKIAETSLSKALEDFFNGSVEIPAKSTLVDTFNKYLDDKFNLKSLQGN